MQKLVLLATFLILLSCTYKPDEVTFKNSQVSVTLLNQKNALWKYKSTTTGKELHIQGPSFEIDGRVVNSVLKNDLQTSNPVKLKNGVTQYSITGSLAEMPDIKMTLTFCIPQNNPVVRFYYELESEGKHHLTKSNNSDQLSYLTVSLKNFQDIKEIRFSEFNEKVHSFCLSERTIERRYFEDSAKFMGPLIVASNGKQSLLLAYEHGSQVPDRFLEYSTFPDYNVSLNAVKGNYYSNYPLIKNHPFRTIWFEIALTAGTEEELSASYREFVLKFMSENSESRKPYIFYNTWNFQERNRNWNKKPYLADMTMDRMLQEIDIAHQMGIEVFVIDAGWFDKTGDWTPSLKRFPDSLKKVKAKLNQYNMKLGLWFNPTVAAVSSNMYKNYNHCVRTIKGDKGKPWPVWETEESYGMCLVSPYRDAFANELIRLNKELGVTYYKWDAIGQYECDDPNHHHGDSANSPQERLENYAFEIGRSMSYVVDKLSKACPEAIVDFDITEGGRTVGLSFLSSGKYFLINNGPYYMNYDIPFDKENDNWNIFFYPGPARGWICRTPLTYDKWIPSVLFLTHYLPDDPISNQSVAAGSLILGQNGIWGDLPGISKDGIKYFKKTLDLYKQVRDDMTAVSLTLDGAVGGSPEIYEKINPFTGKGAVVIFSSHPGKYQYITKTKVAASHWESEESIVKINKSGQALITTEFKTSGAKIIYFGISEK